MSLYCCSLFSKSLWLYKSNFSFCLVLMSSSVATEVGGLATDGDSVGKLNWTDLAGLAGGCTARDFTVSMTFKHRATVVEMADWSSPAGLEVAGVDKGGVTMAVVKGCGGLEELGGKAGSGVPIKGKTE